MNLANLLSTMKEAYDFANECAKIARARLKNSDRDMLTELAIDASAYSWAAFDLIPPTPDEITDPKRREAIQRTLAKIDDLFAAAFMMGYGRAVSDYSSGQFDLPKAPETIAKAAKVVRAEREAAEAGKAVA